MSARIDVARVRALHDAASAYEECTRALDEARAELHEEVRGALAGGLTAYRVAQITGLSQTQIGRIRREPT